MYDNISISYNGGEVARIERNKQTKKSHFYVLEIANGWDYMQKVNKKAFIDYLVKAAAVCLTTWSDELFNDYIRLLQVARYTEEEEESGENEKLQDEQTNGREFVASPYLYYIGPNNNR